ncbi:protein snakeskin-like [Arctopsyche grandis]|uniref:protein snakeskin-like n=1 Tax=Arctopsyche grandis TaxID=121162 RepID=UPI00406D76EF
MSSSVKSVRSIILKICKLVLNLITLILYRVGFKGNLLGIGGTWNLNDDKSADAEIVASGVFVGYFIYTTIQIISDCFRPEDSKRQLTDVLMSFVGIFMWFAVGGAAIHYWSGYGTEDLHWQNYAERKVGLALGSLCIVNGLVYFVDTVLAVVDYYRDNA